REAPRRFITELCSVADRFIAPAALSSPVIPFFGVGEAAGEFIDVTSADEPVHGGVTGRRHRPGIAGCLAVPDQPPRVLAPQPLQADILLIPVLTGGHRRCRPT